MFQNGYQILAEQGPNKTTIRLQLSYPLSTVYGITFSLQPSFFGVELFDDEPSKDDVPKLLGGPDNVFGRKFFFDKNSFSESNGTKPLVDPLMHITNMKSVKMLTLQFRAEHRAGWTDEDVKKWEMKLVDVFEKYAFIYSCSN